MTKAELIANITKKYSDLSVEDMGKAVKCITDQMSTSLIAGERIELRGFGSFSLHYRPPRMSRNPKTGEPIALTSKYVPHFKPGKALRERVNGGNRENTISG